MNRRDQAVLELADHPSSVPGQGVRGGVRHPAADAPERRPHRGAQEGRGHQRAPQERARERRGLKGLMSEPFIVPFRYL